ncbi:hypothetical protein GCM10009557_80000 [Virgisporangium ochraceum]
MLYVFGFERVAVVVGDIYFVDPEPHPGQEGAEHGVRLELRVIERGAARGSIYSATPVTVDRPVWRADLLQAVGGRPFDRTHHHPVFTGWDPGPRVFTRELSADPLGWVAARLADLPALLGDPQVPPETAAPGDADELRRVTSEVVDVTRRLLDRIAAGELATNPEPDRPVSVDGRQVLVRSGWL